MRSNRRSDKLAKPSMYNGTTSNNATRKRSHAEFKQDQEHLQAEKAPLNKSATGKFGSALKEPKTRLQEN